MIDPSLHEEWSLASLSPSPGHGNFTVVQAVRKVRARPYLLYFKAEPRLSPCTPQRIV